MRRSIDGLVEKAPDDGEAAMNRGFHVSNRRVNGSIGATEERRDLVDTEQRVRIEREREKHLTAGEVLLVERRSVGENRLKIAVTAPDSVEMGPQIISHTGSVIQRDNVGLGLLVRIDW